MKNWPCVMVGILVGLAGAAAVLATRDLPKTAATRPAPTLLSDCEGPIQELVIHYVPEAGDVAADVYREFLGQLPEQVVVRAVCQSREAFADLVDRVGPVSCSLKPVVVGHEITTWSRDRWLALRHDGHAGTTLLCPRGEKNQQTWPARAGDALVGYDLQQVLRPRVRHRRSALYFDGGDFVADRDTAFVTPDVALRNVQGTVSDRNELVARLERDLGLDVVLLENAPPHHAGMFMMVAGQRTVVVGDPLAALQLLEDAAEVDQIDSHFSSGADFSSETVARFRAVADQCRRAGYQVLGIPAVPGNDGLTYLTYVNVITDQQDGHRVVYMPVYEGLDTLNEAAARVWSGLGYQVRRVDCTNCAPHFGSLRCLVNVLTRGE